MVFMHGVRGGLTSTSAPSTVCPLHAARLPCRSRSTGNSRSSVICQLSSDSPETTSSKDKKALSSSEELQARIRKAREYKSSVSGNKPAAAETSSKSKASGGVGPVDSGLWKKPNVMEEQGEGTFGPIGSATEAASFLKGTAPSQSVDPSAGMSAEQFSLKKEEDRKKIQVEIISVDNTYRPTREGVSEQYQPKVSTWGVFPRPENISKAFGGGRTIRPGAPLETEEAKQARTVRVAAALEKYKQQAGLIVDPVIEAKAQEAFDAANVLFEAGALTAALEKYSESADLVSARSKLGGQALLQKGICLDSLARSEEAFAVYKLIERHPTPLVAKKAKQMLFGFKAMDSLKTHTISYSVSKGAYSKYFDNLSGQWNNVYFSDKSGPASDNRIDAIIATSVMLAPLVLLGVKILKL